MVPSLEDSYNGKGSLQANKTSKKTEFKLKTVRKGNKRTLKQQAIS